MKIVVFCDKKYLSQLGKMNRFLKTLMIEPHYYSMEADWDMSREKALLKALEKSREYLIIGDRSSLFRHWMSYIMGYVKAGTKENHNLLFYLMGSTRKLPQWLKPYPIVKSMESLFQTWKKNIPNWTRQSDKTIATKRIQALGYYLSVNDFFISATEGDDFLFMLFLEAGFSPNVEDKDGVPMLCHVIRLGYINLIPRLLFWGADVNLMAHDRANTPIMEAASKGLNDVVSLLVERGAELDHISKNNQTALILAVGNGQIDAARILIEAGADCSPKDQLGMDAMKYAQLYGYQELIDLIELRKS